jgi:rod shape determining protein RodA
MYLLLVFFGWINIYSAVYDESSQSIFDFSQRYGKQFLWIVAAIIIGFFVLMIEAKIFSNFAFLIYLAMLALLAMVLMFGKEIAGSKSWFQMGPVAIQPAEFAKFATILALAKYLVQRNVNLKKFKYLIRAVAIIAIPSLLILLQNDTGSALVYLVLLLVLYREGMSSFLLWTGITMGIIFLATLYFDDWMVLYVLSALAVLLILIYRKNRKTVLSVIFLWMMASGLSFGVDYAMENVLEAHQKTRINVLLGIETDTYGAGYNVHQSKIAIGSGGLTGKGFLQGTQTKYNFVPEQSTDFIFCTVGEEWGFIGATIVILVYLGLFFRLIKIAERQRSDFSRIYGYGVVSILFFHFTINIGMTLGLFPVIGIPLPFFSYGGSSLWAFTILLFIFLRLDAERKNILY